MKAIIDLCCGSKMFYFDKNNPNVEFCDIRQVNETLCDGRKLYINPDTICDFRKLPFEDNSFYMAVYDPPHILKGGKNSWLVKKYGKLSDTWEDDLKQGFNEAMRVLKQNGVLIFKWNEVDIPVSKIIAVFNEKPILGHRVGRLNKTHWLIFMKY